jgi:hypothetical protein
VIDQFTDCPVLQYAFQHLNILIVGIEPGSVFLGGDNGRHAVMDRQYGFTGRLGDNGAGLVELICLALVVPFFPQAGKGKRFFIWQGQKIGFHISFDAFPFIKTVRNNQASPLFECSAEAWLGCHGFSPGIDHFIAHGNVFGPERDQTPVKQIEHIFLIAPYKGQYLLRRSNVVARNSLGGRLVNWKIFFQFLEFSETNKSAAHAPYPFGVDIETRRKEREG